MPLLDGNYRNWISIENGTCILDFPALQGFLQGYFTEMNFKFGKKEVIAYISGW